MPDERPRPMTRLESELLQALLSHDFPGVEALRRQMRGLLVTRDCPCDCGTLTLIPPPDSPRSSSPTFVPVSGHVLDAEGSVIGGVLLSVDDGLLDVLEVHWTEAPLPMPAVENVEWQV